MSGNWRKTTPIKPGACHGSPGCRNPAGESYYCPRHRALYRNAQNRRRALRRQLGFCIFCRDPAAPGYTRCTRHRTDSAAANQKDRDKNATVRGWKMVKVPITRETADGQQRRAGGTR